MADGVVPVAVLENLAEVQSALIALEGEFDTVLPRCKNAVLEQLHPVDRAATFLQLAKAARSLVSLYLRTKGLVPNEHPVNSEFERVSLYEEKVQKAEYKRTAPARPAASIDVQAAGRFIEHAIPDLTEEQKRRVREIGVAGSNSRKERKKRKLAGDEPEKKKSVAEAAAAFLAEAHKELLDAHKVGVENK